MEKKLKKDPTRPIRKQASEKSRKRPGSYVYINKKEDQYYLAVKRNRNSILVYKNGSEIAL